MPHQDSPTGEQFHIRYESRNDPGRFYWTSVYTDVQQAQQMLERLKTDPYVLQAHIFQRRLTLWQEL